MCACSYGHYLVGPCAFVVGYNHSWYNNITIGYKTIVGLSFAYLICREKILLWWESARDRERERVRERESFRVRVRE
jgi:hypothetical protein